MLTIEKLKQLNVDTEEGLNRCLNREDFYLKLVDRAIHDQSFEKLEEALKEEDLDRAFEIAHSLKGVLGNLSLTPLYGKTVEITELLRSRTKMDYSELIEELMDLSDQFRNL